MRSCLAVGRNVPGWSPVVLLAIVFLLLAALPAAAQVVEQQWAARVDGPPHFRDEANAVATDAQGNTFVTGSVCIAVSTESGFLSCSNNQALTTKYDAAGSQIWRAWLSSSEGFASGRVITTDSAGNVYVSFEFKLDQFLFQIVTAKYNPNGVRQWISFYRRGQSLEGRPVAIAVDSVGNTYVTGYLGEQAVNFQPWTTIKYGPNGAISWVARMERDQVFHDNKPTALVVDGQGNVYVTGFSFDGGQQSVALTVKYGPDGSQLWLNSFSPGNNFVKHFAHRGMTLGTDGNIYVTGTGTTKENDPNPAVSSAHVIKYNPTGSPIWTVQHRSPGAEQTSAAAIAVDRQGNSYVAGESSYDSFARTDYVTMKFDQAGGFFWERFHPAPQQPHLRRVAGMVANSFADVYVAVAGNNPATGSNNDITTIKYNTHGNEKWVINYDGPGFGEDQPTGIAIRGGGLFVTGFSTGVNSNLDWATIKYVQDGTSVTPDSLTFATQAVGTTSAPQTLTVTNVAETPLQITGIDASGDFSQSNNCPANLAPGNNCVIQVTFAPTSAGARTGTITVSSIWAGSPQVVELSGTGQ